MPGGRNGGDEPSARKCFGCEGSVIFVVVVHQNQIRGQSFLGPDTRLECFLRGAKFLVKNLRGLKITPKILRGLKIFPSEKNKGCETI